jgi:hypothetical protein
VGVAEDVTMHAIATSMTAVLALTVLTAGPAPALPQQGSGLQRVMPDEGADDPGEDLFARDFDPERWRARMATRDLDRRERAYEALLQRAGFDPAARLFLEELARDPDAGELGWTARLALRELGRPTFGGRSRLPGNFLGGRNPLEDLMQDLLRRGDMSPFAGPLGGLPGTGNGPRGGWSGRTIHLEQRDGRTFLEVVEQVDGEERTTTYEGGSLQEILDLHPELGDLGGLELHVAAGQRVDLSLGLPEALQRLTGPRGLRGLPVAPQRPARPVVTDKFGIIAQPLTEQHAAELGLEEGGLYVERSAPGTYAHLLGIGTGDVLLDIEGQAVRSVEDVSRIMEAHDPEASIQATWIDELGQRRSKSWPPAKQR